MLLQANPKNTSPPAAGTVATEDPEVIIHYLMIPKIVSLSYYFQIIHLLWNFLFFLQSKFLAVIQNTTKPLEGLKVLLYQLFTADEVRQSSLKGRTTVAGGESVGLQREKLELIYCKSWTLNIMFTKECNSDYVHFFKNYYTLKVPCPVLIKTDIEVCVF